MNRSYLKVFFRNLRKGNTVTYINIIGLSVGLTCAMVIMLWIKNEMSYDIFHEHYKYIYRVQLSDYREGTLDVASPITMAPLGPALHENFPEISSFVRLKPIDEMMLQKEMEHHSISNVLAVDSSFFDIFTFKLITGDVGTALDEPYSLVLSETAARKVFGSESPLGRSVLVDGNDHYIVKGIVADPPENSHIKFNALISINTIWKEKPCMKWDCNYSFYTYFLIKPRSDVAKLESKFPEFLWEPLNKKNATAGWREDVHLMSLKSIHFQSASNYEMEAPGKMSSIYMFSAIAFFILFIACINFINLTTAQASKKGKEIGIKKVSGASRGQLAFQLLGEIIIQTSVALVMSIILLELMLPSFNNLIGKNLEVNYLSLSFLIGVISVLVFTTLASGIYPALYLSKFNPIRIFKGGSKLGTKSSGLRNSLIVIQFSISIALIAGTIIIYNQLRFINNFDLGFDKENIITVPLSNVEARGQWKNLKHEFSKLPEITSVGASTFIPGGGMTSNGYLPEGFDSPMMLQVLDIDQDYLETMGIEISLGRNFSDEMSSDKSAFMINEQLAKQLSWDHPLNKTIHRNGSHTVIGVLKDFKFTSLHHHMEPLIITNKPWEGYMGFTQLSVRLNTNSYSQTLQKLEKVWKDHVTSIPFEFSFLEDRLNDQYLTEKRLGETFIYFSALAILISCMGLFGLILFLVDQKTKEIGIRKILGGSISHILILLSTDLTKWILLAFVISTPIIWKIMSMWLSSFAYKTEMSWWLFGLAGLLAVVISWVTIGWHTIKAALKNPVEALRYE